MRGEVVFSNLQPTVEWVSSEPSVTDVQHSSWNGAIGCVSRLSIAGDIALHNKSELIDTLKPGSDGNLCDAEVVLASYIRWGEECARHFLGEFAFVIWNEREQRLFCCRDQMGVRPFFYFRSGDFFTFASHPRFILALPQVPRKLNIRKLASLAVLNGLRTSPRETFHAGIQCLPPGSWMVVDRGGQREQTYWRPEIRDDLIPPREDEVFEALGDLLKQAVECRLARSRKPAALLSGGLDSSSIVSIAGRSLASRSTSVTAFSAVVADEVRGFVQDEREFIDELQGMPGVGIRYVTAVGGGPFDFIEDPYRFETALLRSSRLYLTEALDRAALETGADMLLDGEFGEYGPTNWGMGSYAELAFSGRWRALLRDMAAARYTGERSPLRELLSQVRAFIAPSRRFTPYVLLRREFVESADPDSCPRRPRWPNQRIEQQTVLLGLLARSPIRASVRNHRIRHSYPFLDRRVVEFSLSAPARYKIGNGYRRYLIRRALDGVLPPRIQWRTTKGPFSPDYFHRYNAQLGKAREFVNAIGTNDPVRSVVDVDRLRGLLMRPPVSDGDMPAIGLIPSSIYLICFLRQFPEFRS